LAEGEVCEGDCCDAEEGWEETHCDVGDVRFEVVSMEGVSEWFQARGKRVTCLPISLKSKSPSNRPTRAASVIRSLASGGCTSMKNVCLIYFLANPPKCTSSNLQGAAKVRDCPKTKGQRTYTTLDGCQIFQHRTTTAKTVNPTIHLVSPFPIPISLPYQCSFLCDPFPAERLCPDESDDGPYTCCLSLASASESGRALARGAREGSMVGFLRVMDASGA
jgi:hypothetical protein